MTPHFQPHFKSTSPLFRRDKMFDQMRDAIKNQEYFRLRVSNWECIPPSNLNINLENITRLYYLDYVNDRSENYQIFKMIARMTTIDGQNIYVDLVAEIYNNGNYYERWCENLKLKVKFDLTGDIFYCTDPAIFMSLVLDSIRLTDQIKNSIFRLLYEDGIDIKNDYQKYRESLTNSDTRREHSPETLFKLCEKYYRDNAKLYERINALVIPKIEIENIGNINKFSESVAVYQVDRPIDSLVNLRFLKRRFFFKNS